MRILLDECVPKPLKKHLADYDIKTVVEMSWAGTKNGALLKRMSKEGFNVLLTADQNLKYEQNLEKAGISVIVMVAPSNRLQNLAPLTPKVCDAIGKILPGDAVEV